MLLPSTELHVVAADANGVTKTFDSNASDPADRPRGIQFATQLQSGFYTGGFDLRRQIDRDNDDLHKLDDIKFMGADGDTAYEGYVGGLPRSMDETSHTLGVTTAGWMGHAADEPFNDIFVDRDLGGWKETSITRRVALIGSGYRPEGANLNVAPDATGTPGLISTRPGVMNLPVNEFIYDAGEGNLISKLYVGLQTLAGLAAGDANLEVYAIGWSDDAGSDQVISANLKALSTFTFDMSATPRRFVAMFWRYNSAAGGTNGIDYAVRWQQVAAYGDQGIPLVGVGNPPGVAASDVLLNLVGQFAPRLNTAGVQSTSYAIRHLAFREDTTVYDALLKLNSYHQWKLAVWEDRTLHFEPIDLTDWDWEVRHDEIGTTIGLQGDSVEGLRNGIKVQFTNVETGAVEVLLPDDYPELRDDSIDNPANQHGRRMYGTPFVIPFPTIAADALELGRAKLAQDLQPKAPGSFTINRYVRDRSGTWQPAWKVRAGDRVRLTSTLNLSDRPRLIHETSYNHDSGTLTIAVDATLQILEAIFDRQQTARQAAGLA